MKGQGFHKEFWAILIDLHNFIFTKDAFLFCTSSLPMMEFMRNRDTHRENVENILAISLPIVTMQHIRESSSASYAMGISAGNAW